MVCDVKDAERLPPYHGGVGDARVGGLELSC
jgi:hypothetical protein